MKRGPEADQQYRELAAALRFVGAGWVVDEVEEVTRRGKTVAFEDLPSEEQDRYGERFQREAAKGLSVRKARSMDEVGVPYEEAERLALLAEAADRVVQASVRAHAYVTEFARQNELDFISLEEPAGIDAIPPGERREVQFIGLDEVEGPLESLEELLRSRVVE